VKNMAKEPTDEEILKWMKNHPSDSLERYRRFRADEQEREQKEQYYQRKCKRMEKLCKELVGKTISSVAIDDYGNNEEYDEYDPPKLTITFTDDTRLTIKEPNEEDDE